MIELMVGYYGFWIEHADGLEKYGAVPASWASSGSRGTQQDRSRCHLLPHEMSSGVREILQQCLSLPRHCRMFPAPSSSSCTDPFSCGS